MRKFSIYIFHPLDQISILLLVSNKLLRAPILQLLGARQKCG